MQAISSVINKVKDGYIAAINWMGGHLHITFWSAVGAIVVLAVL
jgi:hypothetical protein